MLTVPAELLVFARELRKQQTDAETLLWRILRDRRFCGFKFRRQHPLAGYILDFYCREASLAVELDGSGHNEQEQRLYDKERTHVLARAGIRVVRFWNHYVLNATEDVLEELFVQLMMKRAKS
ncbi:MAG: endonuclease domain-containing protein [Desulfuromonadaceae bacterium]|nr:endonuclease domain-containing protein [Desulfuromonadaceae bacterium]